VAEDPYHLLAEGRASLGFRPGRAAVRAGVERTAPARQEPHLGAPGDDHKRTDTDPQTIRPRHPDPAAREAGEDSALVGADEQRLSVRADDRPVGAAGLIEAPPLPPPAGSGFSLLKQRGAGFQIPAAVLGLDRTPRHSGRSAVPELLPDLPGPLEPGLAFLRLHPLGRGRQEPRCAGWSTGGEQKTGKTEKKLHARSGPDDHRTIPPPG